MINDALQEALQKHDNLKVLLGKYPAQAASLSQALNDLTYASQWQHLSIVDIDSIADKETSKWPKHCGRALIIGLRPESKGLEAVWCCSMSDMLNTAIFYDIFGALDQLDITAEESGKALTLLRTHFLIAVHSTDATVVYYNMARGLVKPVN